MHPLAATLPRARAQRLVIVTLCWGSSCSRWQREHPGRRSWAARS
eukprot:SAG11_NODE_1368_length_5097_cov_3.426170_8_plen_44_part_01